MNKRCQLLIWVTLAGAGCAELEADAPQALDCGRGEFVAVGAHTYCIFESKVVIETGFSCPEGTLPAEHEGIFVCGEPEGLDDEALSALGRAIDRLSGNLNRPEAVTPSSSAPLAAMTSDERAADRADEAAASSDETLSKSAGTEEASGN